MSQEVKVTIEWNGNTAGLHSDPMTVHFAGKADPKKVIGAVVKAMGMSETEAKENAKTDEEFIHIEPQPGGKVIVINKAEEKRFPSWDEALDYALSIRENWS
jgi:hypothetical protein